MSKGNIFMGVARGKVGDLVLYRKDGEQISRVRVRKIGNPRTTAQMVQRVFMSTTSRAYSTLQAICDHSFEGQNGVLRNMSRFTRLNIDDMNLKYKNSPTTWRGNASYNKKNESVALANEYIISEGSLNPMLYVYDNSTTALTLIGQGQLQAAPTYQQVVDYLGVKQGDQISFVYIEGVNENTAQMGDVRLARIILEPSDGDMTKPFLQGGKVNLPNPRNIGSAGVSIIVNEGQLVFDTGTQPIGYSVILSRYDNNTWKRSKQTLTVNSAYPVDATLGDAVDSWEQAASSSLFLNQAES